MWFFSSVSTHVHQEHILRLKWFLFPHAALPATDELFATVLVDVVAVDVLNELLEMLTLLIAVAPTAHVIMRLFHAGVTVVDTLGFLWVSSGGSLAPIRLGVHFRLIFGDRGVVYDIGRNSFII